MRRLLIILVGLVLVSVPVVGFSATEQRVALVIGNSNYINSPLRNPVNDATDMAKALRNLGFKVTLKTDANQRTMEGAIRAFGTMLRLGGVGLFYYAGHGIQSRGTNYLIPVHAEIKSEADVKYRSVDAGYVLSQMEDAGNNLNIIILDACRNNPFARSFRSADKGLAKMDAPTGSILAYSTAPGSVAADGAGRNGLYTAELLKHMATPGITIERVFKKVRIAVMNKSSRQQVPWESSSLTGDFFFTTGRGLSVIEKAPIQELTMVASIPPAITEPKIVARDGRFVQYENGIVFDENTGFEWYAGPDRTTNWNDAKSWVKNLTVASGGWRMPTSQELKNLYKKGTGKRNMTPLLRTTGWYVWSVETKGSSSAWGFSFDYGVERWRYLANHNATRGFAVRSRRR